MYKAEISQTLFKLLGLWSGKSSKGIYSLFSIFMILFAYSFASTTVLFLFQDINIEDFADSAFSVVLIILGCAKMATIMTKQSKILDIINMLCSSEYEPRDDEESRIQKSYDKISRTGTIIYTTWVALTISTMGGSILFAKIDGTPLLYRVWLPYSLENRNYYYMTFLHHYLAGMIIGQTSVAGDSFIMVMMLQICGQLDILKHRLEGYAQLCCEKFPNNPQKEKELLRNLILHQKSLYLFGRKLNDAFNIIFSIELFAVTVCVCTCTYLLTILSATSIKFMMMVFSLICVMISILMYCWHGNMVMEKSMELKLAAYNTSWYLLSNSSKKDIIFIMNCSAKPILFTTARIAPISISTFNSILRVSYSIYNFLMQIS